MRNGERSCKDSLAENFWSPSRNWGHTTRKPAVRKEKDPMKSNTLFHASAVAASRQLAVLKEVATKRSEANRDQAARTAAKSAPKKRSNTTEKAVART